MSRINYPGGFPSRKALLLAIKAKHDADGDSSPLLFYLTEQGIDLNAAVAGAAQAGIHHDSSGLLRRQAENHSQLRDTRFDPVFSRMKGQVQFLKSLYKGNVKALGNWGITIDGQSRVVYPTSFEERAALFSAFAAKPAAFPAGASPLQPYLTQHGIDLAAEGAMVAQAVLNNKNFGDADKASEAETASRNNLHEPIMAIIRGIGDFLKKLFNENAKTLGAWALRWMTPRGRQSCGQRRSN